MTVCEQTIDITETMEKTGCVYLMNEPDGEFEVRERLSGGDYGPHLPSSYYGKRRVSILGIKKGMAVKVRYQFDKQDWKNIKNWEVKLHDKILTKEDIDNGYFIIEPYPNEDEQMEHYAEMFLMRDDFVPMFRRQIRLHGKGKVDISGVYLCYPGDRVTVKVMLTGNHVCKDEEVYESGW